MNAAAPLVEVRALSEADAAAYREIRLRALREDPVPFLASYEEEASRSMDDFASRLRTSDPATQVLGALRDGLVVGTLGFYRHAHTKARHRVSLWGMYVAREERRRGIGKALLDEAIARLRSVGDVEQIELTVVQTEEPARRLYLVRGFEVQGVVRGAMKDGEQYFHEELLILRLIP
jgi:ribosomal protein S18 acetylase RimI-like enzyme